MGSQRDKRDGECMLAFWVPVSVQGAVDKWVKLAGMEEGEFLRVLVEGELARLEREAGEP